MSHRRDRITELLEADNLEKEDLLEVVDMDDGPNADPVSRKTSIEQLVDFIISYDSDAVRDTLTRYIEVDDSFKDNQGPTFNSLEFAVDYARGIINNQGGKVLMQLYYDSNGNPLSTDLNTYGWYSPDPADSEINIISESNIFGGSSGFISELIGGKQVDLNDLQENYDLDNFRTNINLGGKSSEQLHLERLESQDSRLINQDNRLSTLEGYNLDSRVSTLESYNLDSRVTQEEFITDLFVGEPVDLNNSQDPLDLQDFRVPINF